MTSQSLAAQNPLVSVVIPCYNVAEHVMTALHSLVNQTHQNLEVICVDDGSTDGTIAVIEEWRSANRECNLKFIQQNNSGACAARNLGLKMAGGDFIQFLDADDVLLPEKIAHQVGLFQRDPELSFVAGAYFRCKTSGKRLLSEVKGAKLLEVYFGAAGITSANLFRKSEVEKVKGWNEQLKSSQEADLMFRILINGGSGLADNTAYTEIHERDSGQISKGDPVKRLRNYLAVRTEMIDALQEKRPDEWSKNRPSYQSFLVSTLLVLNRYEQDAWREYALYIPYKSDLVSLAGLSKKNIRLIRLMGYTNYFRLAAKLKPKKI